MKTATVFIVSYGVITKYRSFIRKTKQKKTTVLYADTTNTVLKAELLGFKQLVKFKLKLNKTSIDEI